MLCSLRVWVLSLCGLVALLYWTFVSSAAETSLDHVTVTYDGVDKKYAQAVAQTVEAARDICRDKFGFDMPPRIEVSIRKDVKRRPRLFNDGVDQFQLSVRSDRDLRRPSRSGVFHLYGLCHEVAHLGMYRPIPRHNWMSTAAAEGWAHYLGSRLVDEVYEREGGDLWPDRYDYRADGTARLEKQLADERVSPTQQGARLWRELSEIVGEENIPQLFEAWGKAEIDPTDPARALLAALKSISDDKRVLDWWNRAESLFLIRQEKSGFAAQTAKKADLTGSSIELEHDDGKSAGKKSVAGGGHAVRFEKPAGDWYLTAISIYGSRYGRPRAPREDFHVWLCDADFKVIAEFSIPYAKFHRGAPKWVQLNVTPTKVPREFVVCAGFNPSARKGVFVHYDAESSGKSFSGLPERRPRQFQTGDWMIRAEIDQLKSADALGTDKK